MIAKGEGSILNWLGWKNRFPLHHGPLPAEAVLADPSSEDILFEGQDAVSESVESHDDDDDQSPNLDGGGVGDDDNDDGGAEDTAAAADDSQSVSSSSTESWGPNIRRMTRAWGMSYSDDDSDLDPSNAVLGLPTRCDNGNELVRALGVPCSGDENDSDSGDDYEPLAPVLGLQTRRDNGNELARAWGVPCSGDENDSDSGDDDEQFAPVAGQQPQQEGSTTVRGPVTHSYSLRSGGPCSVAERDGRSH